MKQKKNSKPFDCVAFKRRAQTRIYRDIMHMTPQQEIAYFERRAEEGALGDWWKQVRAASRASATHRPARRSA